MGSFPGTKIDPVSATACAAQLRSVTEHRAQIAVLMCKQKALSDMVFVLAQECRHSLSIPLT